jgi:CDGSH-type Zn-finger protein/uncharacterized Fe-S cluster protein YjdI
MTDKQIVNYPGKQADVRWDGRLCLHVAECGRARNDLFVAGRKPWCQPDCVSVPEVVDVVERCPSGALTYAIHGGGRAETAAAENTVAIGVNGPLFARGALRIAGAPADMPGLRFRAALCRCGRSKSKPFCDNSHEATGFRDYGAVGETGPGAPARGGPLEITPSPDGTLLLAGNVALIAGSGRAAWRGDSVALCRCGASNNKPFCDGSHTRIGFKSG